MRRDERRSAPGAARVARHRRAALHAQQINRTSRATPRRATRCTQRTRRRSADKKESTELQKEGRHAALCRSARRQEARQAAGAHSSRGAARAALLAQLRAQCNVRRQAVWLAAGAQCGRRHGARSESRSACCTAQRCIKSAESLLRRTARRQAARHVAGAHSGRRRGALRIKQRALHLRLPARQASMCWCGTGGMSGKVQNVCRIQCTVWQCPWGTVAKCCVGTVWLDRVGGVRNRSEPYGDCLRKLLMEAAYGDCLWRFLMEIPYGNR